MEWKTFDEWLQYKHSEWHPELLDDDLPDAYGDWLAGLSEDEWIDYGNRFAAQFLAQHIQEVNGIPHNYGDFPVEVKDVVKKKGTV
jgi:hypothetical protein